MRTVDTATAAQPATAGWRPKLEGLRQEALELRKELEALRQMLEDAASPQPTLEVGDTALDAGRHCLRIGSNEIALTRTQFRLLAALLRHPGMVLGWERLLREVAPWANSDQQRILNAHLARLRQRLGMHAHRLETVHGVGCRWQPED